MKRFAILATMLAATGCAAPAPELARDQYLALVSRTYDGTAPDTAIAAAEKVLRFSDTDFEVRHFEDGFEATRNWSIYLIFSLVAGSDAWSVRATPVEDGTELTVRVEREEGVIQQSVRRMESPALYDVFWARLDWMLGVRPDWMTCVESNRRIAQDIVVGKNDALCSITNENRFPGETDRVVARL